MGGTVPLGYDLKERKLIASPKEAKIVLRLLHSYLELGCVSKLKARLDQEGIKSRVRISAAGNRSGGTSYSRGALYKILQNRIYLGEIHHRGQSYTGEHSAIIPRELWERVQAQLKSDNQGRRYGLKANASSLLVGLMEDAKGKRFTPSHTLKNGKRYRYYVCQTTIDGCGRLPAHDIERQVALRLQSFLQSTRHVMDELGLPEDPPARTQQLIAAAMKRSAEWLSASPSAVRDFVRTVVQRVVVHPDRIEVEISKRELQAALAGHPHATSRRPVTDKLEQNPCDVIRLEVDARSSGAAVKCGS
jgi:site-specific DNA recombinase